MTGGSRAGGAVACFVIWVALVAPVWGTIPEESGPLWAAHHGGPGSAEQGRGITVSPDAQTVFVTGVSSILSNGQHTIAYSASTGERKWSALKPGFTDVANNFYGPEVVAVTPDGSTVFVTGAHCCTGANPNFGTIAYSASTGEELWFALYDASEGSIEGPKALSVSNDGTKVFVTGASGGGLDQDWVTVSYDAATGEQRWVARFENDPLDSSYDMPTAITVGLDDSKVYVAGEARIAGWDGGTVVEFDASTGAVGWTARPSGSVRSIVRSPDGARLYVSGNGTAALAAETGELLWSVPASGVDPGEALGISPDGSTLYVTSGVGSEQSFTSDYGTRALSASSGETIWVTQYDGPAGQNDVPLALDVSPDGSHIFVTGRSSSGPADNDYATVAYSATGSELWGDRYAGLAGRDDYAYAIAASPDGAMVTVTGVTGWDGRADPNITTVAYRANSCANGRDETGHLSGLVNTIEPASGPARPFVQGINCDVVAANGL